ncbi:MAG: TraR/DksA family transcriptional regulator [Deltaproteobacteria bacterium]|nr:TraR/DksA family transcriptional regulator [Deltaproteobacteria bacterium]
MAAKKKTQKKTKPTAKKKALPKKSVSAPKKAAPAKKTIATKKPTPIKKSSFKKEMLKKLENQKTRLLHELALKMRSESDTDKFEIGDIYDIASNERERELTLTLGDRERERLLEIEDAIDHLNDPDYGLCEECSEPIGEERLRALPFTKVCVECKTKNERTSFMKGRYEEEPPLGILEKTEGEEDLY